MPTSTSKSESSQFTPWNSPHLLISQFLRLAKLIQTLNVIVPPEKINTKREIKELEIFNAFSRQMMPSWLALAKSYYPFYKKSDSDKALIEELEKKLTIKATDYESLSMLIKEVFLTRYPIVHSSYKPFIDNIIKVMAKLTAVALSTPVLINDAHKHNKKQFEEAGPSMSNCISPIETILRQMMDKEEVDKAFIISATSLLLQVKAIKSHFEQLTLIQKLEDFEEENEMLGTQLQGVLSGETLRAWQSKEEQQALARVFKLQTRVNQYYNHLTSVLAKSPMDEKVGAKLASITVMKNALEVESELPSQRIGAFEKQLNDTKDELKDHRDPMWIRFLRDCLRILAFTFSGVAIYRAITNQPVNFFKPSHGQHFVDEVNQISSKCSL